MLEESNNSTKQRGNTLVRMRDEIIDTLANQIIENLETHTSQLLDNEENQDNTSFPKSPKEIRDIPFYNSIHNAVLWQRDNYFLGQEFANLRKNERRSGIIQIAPGASSYTSLGDIQIAHLGSWFIPSPTVKNALQPFVIALPNDTLRDPIRNAISNAIPLAQPQLNSVAKSSLLRLMKESQTREIIKNYTRGFIHNIHTDN